MNPPDDVIMFEFGRQRIDRLDLGPFLARFGPDKLPENPRRLRAMMGSLVCLIHGYDEDQRELHCIPEVRRFVQRFHAVWPYWLFFFCAVPGASTFEVFTACCLERLNVIEKAGSGVTLLDSEADALAKVLLRELPNFRELCERAEVFPELREQRLKEVFGPFGLPVPDRALQEL